MRQPKVTFLMMAFNAEKYIEKAIESVLQQTERDIVLCIRNNGSTDGTGTIISDYSAKDSRIYVFDNKTNGVTDEGVPAFGEGWWPLTAEMTGEYVAFLDSDDWLASDFTEVLYSAGNASGADMVFGGNYFVDENTGQVTGERIPPAIQTNNMQELEPHFLNLYGSLRTWWGKLYKWEFFQEHYRESWTPVEPLQWVIDTVAMLEYFSHCRSLVCVNRPLYHFLMRNSSTYNTKPLDIYRVWEAESCYSKGNQALQRLGIVSNDNRKHLINIHWGFLIEAMDGIRLNKQVAQLAPLEKIRRIADVLNDKIVSTYLNPNYRVIYPVFAKYIEALVLEDQNENRIWSSYLARLYYFEQNLKNNLDNRVAFPVLMSCLCDVDNKNNTGEFYFSNPEFWKGRNLSKGEAEFLTYPTAMKSFRYDHPINCISIINLRDRTEAVVEQEQQLSLCVQEERFEEACELIEVISNVCPFSPIAMYYRIYIAALMKEWQLVGVLVSAAKVLWPEERDMQLLYWEIYNP